MKRRILAALAGSALLLGSVLPVSALAIDYESLAKSALKSAATALYDEYKASSNAESTPAETTQPVTTDIAIPATDASITPIGMESLDPLPPLEPKKMPDWFDVRTDVTKMTNARLVAEYETLFPYLVEHDLLCYEAPACRETELAKEIRNRWWALHDYHNYIEDSDVDDFDILYAASLRERAAYQRAAASDIAPLLKREGPL